MSELDRPSLSCFLINSYLALVSYLFSFSFSLTFETFLALAITTYGPLGFHVTCPKFFRCDRLPQKLMVSRTVEIRCFFPRGQIADFS